MKKQKRYIRFAWFILICFIAGQTMVYSHQHRVSAGASTVRSIKTPSPVQTVSETCNLCDLMHHTQMDIFTQGEFSPTVILCKTRYIRQHHYKGIALILSAGRSPPSA